MPFVVVRAFDLPGGEQFQDMTVFFAFGIHRTAAFKNFPHSDFLRQRIERRGNQVAKRLTIFLQQWSISTKILDFSVDISLHHVKLIRNLSLIIIHYE